MSPKSNQAIKQSSALYMSLWTVAACAAIGYIAYLIHVGPKSDRQAIAMKSNGLKLAQQNSELKKLGEMIGKTNHSLNQINAKNQLITIRISELEKMQLSADKREQLMIEKLNRIETSIGSVTGALQQTSTKPKNTIKTELKQREERREEPKAKPPLKKDPPQKMIDEKKLKQKKPTVTGKKPTLVQTNFAVALGDYPSLKKLKNAWRKVSSKHKKELSTLNPRYVPILHQNKIRYELISGPLKNALDAAQLCYRLLQAETACKQAIYQGKKI